MPSDAKMKELFREKKMKELFMKKKRGPEKFDGDEAFWRGAGQGATMGFSDEIYSGAKTGFGMLGDYDKEVADQRRQNKQSAAQHQGAALGGDIAGSVAASFIPGLGQVGAVAKAAKMKGLLDKYNKAKTWKKAVAGGAAFGAGVSEEKLIDNPLGLAKDTAMGAGVGGLTHGATSLVSKGARGLGPKALAEKAEGRMGKHVVGNRQKGQLDLGKAGPNAEDAEKYHKEALRSGRKFLDARTEGGERLIKAGETVSDTAPKLYKEKKSVSR